MKITLNYLPSLGSFLDEQNIDFYNHGNGTISFQVQSIEDAFELGIKYKRFIEEIIENSDY